MYPGTDTFTAKIVPVDVSSIKPMIYSSHRYHFLRLSLCPFAFENIVHTFSVITNKTVVAKIVVWFSCLYKSTFC